jgi:UDP-N-acetylglucosamine 1-carboxyvinyltransferase
LAAIQQLGAEIDSSRYGYSATSTGLRGAVIKLPYPSVGATENAIFAAVLAKGTTVIANAAVEPEVIDTILFLQKMGARITVDVDRRIIVDGVSQLHGARHNTITDRIEVASFAIAAVATNGSVRVMGAQQSHMISFLNNLRKVGGAFDIDDQGITFFRESDVLRPIHLETDVHPGFMTDWQQPFVVLLTQADGVSVIHETVYENRFGYTHSLNEMGADVDLCTSCLGSKSCRFQAHNFEHSCIVRGPSKLEATSIVIPDLRAGFAYIIAALLARGTTQVTGINYLERGYASVPEKLSAIGAVIDVVDPSASKAA